MGLLRRPPDLRGTYVAMALYTERHACVGALCVTSALVGVPGWLERAGTNSYQAPSRASVHTIENVARVIHNRTVAGPQQARTSMNNAHSCCNVFVAGDFFKAGTRGALHAGHVAGAMPCRLCPEYISPCATQDRISKNSELKY